MISFQASKSTSIQLSFWRCAKRSHFFRDVVPSIAINKVCVWKRKPRGVGLRGQSRVATRRQSNSRAPPPIPQGARYDMDGYIYRAPWPRRMFLKICFKISHASQERKILRNMPCLGRDPLFLLWLLWSPQLSIWFSLLGACYSAA